MGTALREITKIILLALVIFLVASIVVGSFRVDGESMEPSLHNGQYLLVNEMVYHFHPPQRGDIIVFHSPNNPGKDFIKRVIAIPGDTVEIRDGQVYINGEVIEEPYISEPPNYTYPPTQVGEDEYFVLGDNRNHSSDSHIWGMVPRENIIGKAWLCYWPLSQWGLAPNYLLSVGSN